MPPARTGSTGAATGINVPATSLGSTPTPYTRPARTERTHSENQERAYIAASRRSDRSLEARVESARRASEIHKQRTGRALRVTEQDVINEEMYEEEDDDLPHQYRRLTAHLHNNSGDFNRRLSSYLGSHVAIRQALQDAIASSYVQTGQQSPYAQPHMVPPSLAGTPQMQQPDPSVNANAWVSQVASASPLQINMPPHVLARAQTQTNQLRPAPHPAAAHHSRSPSATSAVQSVHESSTPATQMSSPAAPAANRPSQMPMEQRVQSSNKPVPNMLPEQPQQPQQHPNYAHTADHGAFSTTLPTETQLFINRPVETVASTKPSLNLANSAVPSYAGARYAGMTQTLALPELDTDLAQHSSWSEANSAAALDATFASAGGMFGYGDSTTSLWDEANNNGYVLNDDDWNAFINTSSYEEAAV